MNAYTFEIGRHTEQTHEYTSALIDEAYARKSADSPTTPKERIEKASELCESHWQAIGQMPSSSVLSRLAWYIVFDEMTDDYQDKVTRDEYPIMGISQLRRRDEIPSANVYFDKREYNGFRTVYEKSDKNGAGYVKRYPVYDPLADEKFNAHDAGIDVLRLLDSARLTDRQREAVELVYFDKMTQVEAGKEIGVDRRTINDHLSVSYRKLREILPKVSDK